MEAAAAASAGAAAHDRDGGGCGRCHCYCRCYWLLLLPARDRGVVVVFAAARSYIHHTACTGLDVYIYSIPHAPNKMYTITPEHNYVFAAKTRVFNPTRRAIPQSWPCRSMLIACIRSRQLCQEPGRSVGGQRVGVGVSTNLCRDGMGMVRAPNHETIAHHQAMPLNKQTMILLF